MGWQRKQGNIRKFYKRNKKEKWTEGKSVDGSCCNNGTCPYCEGNRKFNEIKRIAGAKDDMVEEFYLR